MEMRKSVLHRFDPAGSGMAIAILLATWAEPYAVPDTASVETRLDVIVGLGLPLILILVVVDSLWQRWQGDAPGLHHRSSSDCADLTHHSSRPPRGRGTVDAA